MVNSTKNTNFKIVAGLIALFTISGNSAHAQTADIEKTHATCIGFLTHTTGQYQLHEKFKISTNLEKELREKCSPYISRHFPASVNLRTLYVPFTLNGYSPSFEKDPSERFGLGIDNKNRKDGFHIIEYIFPGSGSQIAGIREGDILQTVEATSTKDKDSTDVITMLNSAFASNNVVNLEVISSGTRRTVQMRKNHILNWAKNYEPKNLNDDGVRFMHGLLLHWQYISSVAEYLNICDNGDIDKISKQFNSKDSSGRLSSILRRGCEDNSYVRKYATRLAQASNKQLEDIFAEKQGEILKEKEVMETWINASAGAKTKDGKDGIIYLTERCPYLKANVEPWFVVDYLSNIGDKHIQSNVLFKELLTSKQDASKLLNPHNESVVTCYQALANLKEKKKIAKQEQQSARKQEEARKNFKGYAGTGMPKSQLDQLCWAGNMANMTRKDGRRNGYAEMVGRGRLLVGNFTRTQYNNYRRYMLGTCPEAW